MRLWSVHPKYLDAKGLVALWREGLLALAVLSGKTIGYKHHPQLNRFKSHPQPILAIHSYLAGVLDESKKRGYRFDQSKVAQEMTDIKIPVTAGQINYEYTLLCQKLHARSSVKEVAYVEKHKAGEIETHPLFILKDGDIEPWEKVT